MSRRVCSSPRSCGKFHCSICFRHLQNGRQRYCGARCRTIARSIRLLLATCEHCGHRQWIPRSALRSRTPSRKPRKRAAAGHTRRVHKNRL